MHFNGGVEVFVDYQAGFRDVGFQETPVAFTQYRFCETAGFYLYGD